MKSKKRSLLLFALIFIISYSCSYLGEEEKENLQNISIKNNGDARIEVGNSYTGVEFHHSCPVPQRISFYYPVANSLDQSTDYWTRDSSYTMAVSIEQNGVKEWLNKQSFMYEQTPYSVSFFRKNKEKELSINYKFAKNYSAIILNINLKNISKDVAEYNIETLSQLTIRTSHTYAKVTEYTDTVLNSIGDIITAYPIVETDSAKLFYLNVGDKPIKHSHEIFSDDHSQKKNEWWENLDVFGNNTNTATDKLPASNYFYSKKLKPGEELNVTQVIGMCDYHEADKVIEYLKTNFQNEYTDFETNILSDVYSKDIFISGDEVIDHSVLWAKAMIKANRHYIDGYFPIMPCPAEYNFYFTHDLLLTNLATVQYNPEQIKKDLEFVISHANQEKIIPHAYYWKDTAYATEFSSYDNWNNFWFVILSASYLKHSGDIEFLELLFPYIDKSVSLVLQNEIKNGLVYSYRPDWWDAGRNYGPRAYMTILANKSLRDFLYILKRLDKNDYDFEQITETADMLKTNLNKKLWSEKNNYLINFLEDGSVDEHYYMGSLLAVFYNLLDSNKSVKLLKSAEEQLLDTNLGIRNAVPMDFHKISEKYGLKNGEEGKVGVYFNGGVWPHANAFYALSLIKQGRQQEAFKFIKKIMTLDEITKSPNGQPAMFEYRNSNLEDVENYGKIDKPSFTWAGGWYLYTLYNLVGAQEGDWNLYFHPSFNPEILKCKFTYYANGNRFEVNVEGKGSYVESIKYDNKLFPSLVVPEDTPKANTITIKHGEPIIPYLESCNAYLQSAEWNEENKTMNLKIESVTSVPVELSVIAKLGVNSIKINDDTAEWQEILLSNDLKKIRINFESKATNSLVQINF